MKCKNCGHEIRLAKSGKYYHYPRYFSKDLKCHAITLAYEVCGCVSSEPEKECEQKQ